VPQDAKVCVVGWPTSILHALATRSDLKIYVVESNGDGDAAVDRLLSMDVNATLVQFENLSRVIAECDYVIVEALATGSSEVMCSAGSHGVAALGYCEQKPVWLVTPLGTRLPNVLWAGMTSQVLGVATSEGHDDHDDHDAREHQSLVDVVPACLFSRVISPLGVSDDLTSPFLAECPPATELLKQSAM
jgi:translation initiation factor 2B subunit (eIF-2B alpha/beta/delta family)